MATARSKSRLSGLEGWNSLAIQHPDGTFGAGGRCSEGSDRPADGGVVQGLRAVRRAIRPVRSRGAPPAARPGAAIRPGCRAVRPALPRRDPGTGSSSSPERTPDRLAVTCSVAARWAGHFRCGGRRSSARAWRANSGLAGHSGSVMGSGSARASGTAGNWVRQRTGSGGEPGADAGVGWGVQASAGGCARTIADILRVDARVVAPGPEGYHRSQAGWASRFPRESAGHLLVSGRGDLNSRFGRTPKGTQGHLASPLTYRTG